VAFDPVCAAGQGVALRAVDLAMMGLALGITVIGLKVVGAVLIVALLIIPPVAARLWTERADRVVLLAGVFGGVAGYLGAAVSATAPVLPTGPLIVLAGFALFVLSLLLALKENEPPGKASLLILPASLLANWKAEMKRFAPTLQTRFIHPSETDKASLAAMGKRPGKAFEKTDVVLTTYGMLLRQKWLLDVPWGLVILDEAQAIKNPATRQTKTVKQLKADARIALTGTPVENRLSDLWSLFDFLCPGLLGSAVKFKKFVKGLETREHDR